MALWINHTDNPFSKDRDLEYIEKKNIVLEYRYAEGNPDVLPLSQPIWSGFPSMSS